MGGDATQELLNGLNPPQRDAVEHTEGPLLILAGAGSGKTRVITRRIAHLIGSGKAHPEQILAVTFTNKAAGEMRERVDELLVDIGREDARQGVTISTFHSLGARMLRRHADRLGLTWSFNILDDVDQLRLIRAILSAQERDVERSDAKMFRGYIERMKNRGLTPRRAHETAFNRDDEERAFFYEDYQRTLRQTNCLDFGDLIMGMLEVLRDDPTLASSYSRQWRFVMVDEFQDTNPAQYELLQLLCSEHDNLAVVGDDDQAIYRWRGATVANILGFEDDFPDAKVVKLEQNYRSTQVILDAAGDIIKHNPSRRDKTLWTAQEGGDPITCFTAQSDREEAQYVADKIRILHAKLPLTYSDFAVFFRTNAQARLFEEQLRFAGIAYQIVGGTSFYQRQEVKDLLAYLKVALNPENQVDLLRIINTPSRSIGDGTQQKLIDASLIPGIGTVFDALRYVIGADVTFEGDQDLIEPNPETFQHDMALEALDSIGGAQLEGLRTFHQTIQVLRDDLMHFDSLAEITRQFLERIAYFVYIEQKHPEVSEDKKQNVAELINAVEEFEKDFVAEVEGEVFKAKDLLDESGSVLSDAHAVRVLRAFLDQSALLQSTDLMEEGIADERVTLMTVHGSKGLEFDTVFLAGMEDELFPSIRDKSDPEEEHEERRLAYVAITRARRELFVTNAKRRRVYGQFKDTAPSRFLLDIDPDRLTVDKKSVSPKVDWRAKRRRTVGKKRELTDEERYFSDGQAADASFSFDQTAPDELAQPTYDEFAQVPPEFVDTRDLFDDMPGDEDELVGKTVTHSRFGIGTVLELSGNGDKAIVTVDFPTSGEKKIMRKFLRVM